MKAFGTWLKDNGYWLQFDAHQKALAEWVLKQNSHEVVEKHLFKPKGCVRLRTLWVLWTTPATAEQREPVKMNLGKCHK